MPTSCARNTAEFCILHHPGWAEMTGMGAARTWARVDIRAKIGEGCDYTFDLTLTLPRAQSQRFEKLPFAGKLLRKLDWVGFISPSKEAAKCWLDEIVIENSEAQ